MHVVLGGCHNEQLCLIKSHFQHNCLPGSAVQSVLGRSKDTSVPLANIDCCHRRLYYPSRKGKLMEKPIKIVLVGAGGMSFGPTMTMDTLRSRALRGSTLALVDIDEKRLAVAKGVAERFNRALGSPCTIQASTDLQETVKDAHFAIISVEVRRYECWNQDYDIPKMYGVKHMLGENGGPGGVFHAFRTVPLVAGICKQIEKVNPNVFVINLTNPMSLVTLGMNKATDLKNIGLCHEFFGGILALMFTLGKKMSRISAKAHGTNHFSWFYEIKDSITGEDLYPRVKRHFKRYPFMHLKLVRHCLDKYGLLTVTSDSHVGEYLPYATDVTKPSETFRRIYYKEEMAKEWLCKKYAAGKVRLPEKRIPRSGEEAIPVIESLAFNKPRRFDAANFPNKGYIPNLPDGLIVEVGHTYENGELVPDITPPMQEDLAEIMKERGELQEMIVDAALNGDAELALEAFCAEPLSPKDRDTCKYIFNDLYEAQKDLLPF